MRFADTWRHADHPGTAEMNEGLDCDFTQGKRRCTSQAQFLCANSHVLCRAHARPIPSTQRRRNTDRFCAVCRSSEITDFLLDSGEVPAYRRADDFENKTSKTAEAS
ncbi:MAG TPA: hypothetical protein VFE17_10145 [Candidatus Baltobacteraceae bacterium]|nr:hypothetical protein [Candidatus Baltobacteraceae bacterium]